VPTTALRRHSPAAPAPASLACFLATNGQRVLEVNRPDRQLRRRHGKSDPVDADAAARTVQAGEATGIPKAADGAAEMVRALRAARQTAVKAPTQAINALKGCWSPRLPSSVSSSRACPAPKLVAAAAVLEPGTLVTPTAATMLALGSLAGALPAPRRGDQGADRHARPAHRQDRTGPARLHGAGPDSAAALLIAAGDNPGRLHSEAAFAALCGASPVEASSGKTRRHRLNRGGDRQANAALYRVVLVRLRWHQPTRDYLARRTTQGKTSKEIIRCPCCDGAVRVLAMRAMPSR